MVGEGPEMISSTASWIALVSWVGVATMLIVDHVAKATIPADLLIGAIGVACTAVVVRAVLSLKSPSRDYREGWLACRRSIEREVARERERMAAPLP